MFRIDDFFSKLTNSISTKHVQHATLCDGLEGWATQDDVHALFHKVAEAQFCCHVTCHLPQLAVVGVGHTGESNAKPKDT